MLRTNMLARPRTYVMAFILYAAAIALYLAVAMRQPIPPYAAGTAADPATFLDPELYERSLIYSAQRNWLFFISYPWEWLVYGWVVFSGLGLRWEQRLEQSTTWNRVKWLKLPLFVLLLQTFVFVCFLPIRLTSYTLSRANGISTQGWGSWLRDRAVDFGVDFIMLSLGAAVVLWLIRRGGRWWVKLWLLSVPVTLFLMYIQPVVIDPLYNDFKRLSNAQLEAKLLALADKANIPADRVFEVNVSEKTNALNAYVNGIGSSLRIVLWDTTLERLTEQEIMVIMAHEMGHYAMHHLEWSAVGAIGSSLVGLALSGVAAEHLFRRLRKGTLISAPGALSSLPVLLLLLSVVSFASLPVANTVSRQAEHAADRYAFELLGSTEGAVTMFQKLAAASLSEMNPPWLVKLFRASHPSLLERIEYAAVRERHEP
ncbi:M48 family metallopeptidase [Paenibacillus sp. YYML68]|uniref:M48 family metallopeptidase n=1 Tax=Paenibacillus sp. YYML68 TaxID=2909250 RepID=UPI00248F5644|nr:M48 family metallopeptidase [Paenibacillus sp. YYML68]